jgi:SAM-dependent methyltransferase
MRAWVLSYLVCSECGSELCCAPEVPDDIDLETGILTCTTCERQFPIRNGVPRMTPDLAENKNRQTAEAFGWEWQEFDQFHSDWATLEAQYLDWVHPLSPPFFGGKVVLDAGCGMGRFSAAAARLGADRVIGVDLSDSVEAARRFTRSMPNVAIVQGDIFRLPFRASFDFAFSIGVIHHLHEPEAGFREIATRVRPGGSLFVWVYGYENNGWIRHIVNPIRENVTARLGRRMLYLLSLLMTAFLHPALRLLYMQPEDSPVARRLPYYPYLHWLSQYGFRHNHMVVFDHLVAPTAFYIARDEFRAWYERLGFRDIQLSWRNQNSWRGFGIKPLEQ